MYVITFYSYKGGVGRTMALVNVAAMLAKAGKRVLVVDFDLEAPGLTSFEPLRCARNQRGLVDYISEYKAELVAPDISDFIVHCPIDGNSLWALPAGDNADPGYAERLNSIDWEKLYSQEHGYAMFEDMKQQWRGYENIGFDYVFIDSRTGHTDVGGICTRQLPDAVVFMFLPNDQNIDGLQPIVESVRADERAQSGEVAIHFCPANVPDEFDEDEVLDKLLKRAADRLGYTDRVDIDQPAAMIHHWSSLVLLNQPVLSLERPNSRLTKEYCKLKASVIAGNIADKDGALEALALARNELNAARQNGRGGDLSKLTRRGQEILRLHAANGEIAWEAAQLFNLLKEPKLEIAALSDAIEHGQRPDDALLARAFALHAASQADEAIADLVTILRSETANRFQLQPAFRVLTFLDTNWLETVDKLYHERGLKFRARILLAEGLMTQREKLPTVITDMISLSTDATLEARQRLDALSNLALALIGAGQFADAIAMLEDEVARSGNAADIFNLAMAIWGRDSSPPRELFEQVTRLLTDNENADANVHQCLAVAFSALGDSDAAKAHLSAAVDELIGGCLIFSCWRYLYVTYEEMGEDLAAMLALLELGKPLMPEFLRA